MKKSSKELALLRKHVKEEDLLLQQKYQILYAELMNGLHAIQRACESNASKDEVYKVVREVQLQEDASWCTLTESIKITRKEHARERKALRNSMDGVGRTAPGY